ncbi:MAG: hypothetical protein QOH93_2061 [Chloroflexia bacterium]|nr:hypothetical protein [Chloroflexia bacterium]
MLSAWITFSAYHEDGITVAQAQALLRAADPVIEMGLRMGGHKQEDMFWILTLQSLAKHFNVDAQAEARSVCVDPKIQWSQARNIKHNPIMRSMIYTAGTPMGLLRRRSGR